MRHYKKNILVYPRRYFVKDLLELKQNGEKRLNLVLNQTDRVNHWLVYKGNSPNEEKTKNTKDSNKFVLKAVLLDNNFHPNSMILQADFLSDGHLYLEIGSKNKPNSISGYIKYEDKIHNLDELFLVGEGMRKIPTINSENIIPLEADYEAFLVSDYAGERWAMTRKALGDDDWKALCLSKIMIAGCGRSGELAAMELARFGVGTITICDGDLLERRNLGEMKLVSDFDLGRNKAEVVVEKLSHERYSPEENDCYKFHAIKSFNFDSFEAQKAAEESDIIICCVDSDGGRGYASYIAARHHKVLLDIGTGVLRDGELVKEGYDIRLILPGDGCLKCCGGIDEQSSEIEMFNRNEQRRIRQDDHLSRAGSLSRINNLAVIRGIKLLQDLCAGKIKNSTWLQYEEGIGEKILNPTPENKGRNCDCHKAGLGNLFL